MCGIAAIAGAFWRPSYLSAMMVAQTHRGPDDCGWYISPRRVAGLAHNRLKIVDFSDAGRQPMNDLGSRYVISFNGEIYNHVELRSELSEFRYYSRTDTEVILAAYRKWGTGCLKRLIGMFAFVIWDEQEQTLFAARDRFGVKPLVYHHRADGTLLIASEIKALHAAGAPAELDPITWSTYLSSGWSDYGDRTFWTGIRSLPAGHWLRWQGGVTTTSRWYALDEEVRETDERPLHDVEEEYLSVLHDSVKLRLRSDAPVGLALSGGMDSGALLALVNAQRGHRHSEPPPLDTFTFATGDPIYDEVRDVRRRLNGSGHRSIVCRLRPSDVPDLAEAVQAAADEPYGGIPTLAYDRLFARAHAEGVTVLLDGQGMDEQWAGYDYYRAADEGTEQTVQGTRDSAVRPECLTADFRACADQRRPAARHGDPVQRLQVRDVLYTKIPRALRYNDRVSMRHSIELREPFLDHRLVELAIRQPRDRKIVDGTSKWLLRRMLPRVCGSAAAEPPKRPMQTPQREWLRGPLRPWVEASLDEIIRRRRDWVEPTHVRDAWQAFCRGESDNSAYVWQWISLAMADRDAKARRSQPDSEREGLLAGMAS